MTITLDAELEATLATAAKRRGVTPDALAQEILRERLHPQPIEPQDDWERRLLDAARDYGVSLSNEALSRESMYD
ncbi:MAG: CopG family transcriptional regulator [Planctomycetaceae bacterium]